MPRDVFEEHPSRPAFADDAGDVRPQVPLVILSPSLSRLGKRLAWVSGKHRVDDAAPGSGIEGREVVPDWRRVQVSGALAGDDGRSGVVLDLDIAGGGKARLGKLKTHVKATAACTEGQASGWWGRCIHISPLHG